jgi:ABC-type nitrate/sulfonate/bicarbonate transport system permease component
LLDTPYDALDRKNEMLPIAVITKAVFSLYANNTATGIRNVDPAMIKAAHILGASEMRILFRVILPNAAPQIFSGLRLSSGMAWRTVLAAEMVTIPTGIGALIMKAESLIRVDIILSCLLVLSIFCLIFEKMLNIWEKNGWVNGAGMPEIKLVNVSNHICHEINLTVRDGEYFVIVGETGPVRLLF